MKRLAFTLSILSFIFTLQAQNYVELSYGGGYVNDVYYSMENGIGEIISNADWELAFEISGDSYGVRTNGQNGVRLYQNENGTVDDWATFDTTGLYSWDLLLNSDTSWSVGAFNRNMIGAPDFGWGFYDDETNGIIGLQTFVIRISDGSLKKIKIDISDADSWTFTYANLDGTDEVTKTISKADYENKNFAYFSFTSGEAFNREPDTGTWDIVFTRYMHYYEEFAFYLNVASVLSNKGIEVAEANDVDVLTADFHDFVFETAINTIGWDWKEFSGMSYQVVSELCYFVKDRSGSIWKIYFEYFAGTSTGEVIFQWDLVEDHTGIDELTGEIDNLYIYPNPSSDFAHIIYDVKSGNPSIEVYDLTGKLVIENKFLAKGFGQVTIPVFDLNTGIYTVKLSTDAGFVTKKLFIGR